MSRNGVSSTSAGDRYGKRSAAARSAAPRRSPVTRRPEVVGGEDDVVAAAFGVTAVPHEVLARADGEHVAAEAEVTHGPRLSRPAFVHHPLLLIADSIPRKRR